MENCYLQNLNESQILPVKDTQGAVLVIAGAGSGKTRVLTNRIAYLVNELNVKPKNILAITFTNKAADEMKNRLSKMVDNVQDMWVSTIHSMCVKILRQNIGYIGYDKNFSIYSEDDKDRVLKRLITSLDLEIDKFLKIAKFHISNAKNEDLSPREYKEENIKATNIGIITEIYAKYQQVLKENNALDFDDLLNKTYHLLAEVEEVKEYYANKFEFVHVDEFQDTNTVQYKIIKALTCVHKNIFVVGDDDQSIYGWRGAKISNILGFEKDFKGAKVYKLEQNYRSTKNILNVANFIIKNNGLRKEKTLWTDNCDGDKVELFVAQEDVDEAEFVATKIKNEINSGKKASDFAILMRVNALSHPYEQEFLKYNIPYKVFGGFKFYDRKEIKDLTAYLRIISNPLDKEAILRVINTPKRGIGEKTINTILSTAEERGLNLFEQIMDVESLPFNSSTLQRIREFKNVLYSLIVESSTQTIEEIVKNVIDKTNFMSQYLEDTEENIDRKMSISQLVNACLEYSKSNPENTLSDFLSSITLSSDTDEFDESNFVSIATIHSVKGLEFDTVFIVGLDETIFPISRAMGSQEELEEERRLMYVAITRAKNKLFLSRARSRFIYGNRNITHVSRFLEEIEPLLKTNENKVNQKFNSYNKGYSSYSSDSDNFGYFSDEPSRNFGKTKSFSAGYVINKTPEISNRSVNKYSVGTKVSHRKFGVGVVVNVRNNGTVIDVKFESVGLKSLATQIAPLEIIN